jgi:hypothetical protein
LAAVVTVLVLLVVKIGSAVIVSIRPAADARLHAPDLAQRGTPKGVPLSSAA